MRRLLFLSRWFPYPPGNGSKLRIYNMLRRLSEQCAITLLSYADQPDVRPEVGPLLEICEAVHTVPYRPFDPGSRRALLGFLGPTPRSVSDTYSPEMEALIITALAARPYDLVIASQIDMAVYHRAFGDVPAVFEEVEIGVLYEQAARASSLRARLRYGLTWSKYRRYLTRLLAQHALATVVSEKEKELVERLRPGQTPVLVVPNGIEPDDYAGFRVEPKPASLIFTGSLTFAPNHEAMRWFVGEVWPLVRAEIPEAELTITGAPGERPLPPAEGVNLAGFVSDVRPLVAGSWASVAPIHAGGGTRLKILEAMALGTPVVATSKGAEGLDVGDGEHLLLADSPADFASATIRLLQSRELRARLAANATARVHECYSWGRIMPHYMRVLEAVAARQIIPATTGASR